MRTHSRRTWPLFVVDACLAVLGLFVLHGVVAGVVLLVTLLAVTGSCVYGLAGEKINDGAGPITGGTGF